MRREPELPLSKVLLAILILWIHFLAAHRTLGVGVTIITHGYDGDVNGWITGMANEISQYYGYTMSITFSNRATSTPMWMDGIA